MPGLAGNASLVSLSFLVFATWPHLRAAAPRSAQLYSFPSISCACPSIVSREPRRPDQTRFAAWGCYLLKSVLVFVCDRYWSREVRVC
ncbi:hypothetical protein QBC41DRAFT_314820 [Cercophora samala]|uniref:Secreted protein n=1 Tax=Cercophora samala TaxID=330535 RepID=A0AA39ZJ21_9PEZI|nr:hypothetical protein QBC41DRAFT_314820 [Cercophora samala]